MVKIHFIPVASGNVVELRRRPIRRRRGLPFWMQLCILIVLGVLALWLYTQVAALTA